MRVRGLFIAVLTAVLTASATTAAFPQDLLQIKIPTVKDAPKLDGTLSDPIWQQAAQVQLTYDRLTHAAAPETTTAYLLTDGKAIYVAYDAKQTRTPIVA